MQTKTQNTKYLWLNVYINWNVEFLKIQMSFFNARNFRIYNAIVPFHSLNIRRSIGNYSSHIALLSACKPHAIYFKPQVLHRGKKTTSSFNFNDLPHGLDLRPLEPLEPLDLEQSIIKDKSPERTSLKFFEHVQDLLQEEEPVVAESQGLPNSEVAEDLEEAARKAKPPRRSKRTESLPQGLIRLDSESSEPQDSQVTLSPSMGGKKIKKPKVSDEVEIHQGLLPLEPLEIEYEPPPYPPVIMQARNNMLKFENCVVITRVGGFYELYFEHADEFGPLLGLKIAQKKTNAGLVSMVSYQNDILVPCNNGI